MAVTEREIRTASAGDKAGGLPALSEWKTISADEVKSYADLTGDQNPIHLRERTAIVHGGLVVGLMSAFCWKLFGDATMVRSAEVVFRRPMLVGDQIMFECWPQAEEQIGKAQALTVRIVIWGRKNENSGWSSRGSALIELCVP